MFDLLNCIPRRDELSLRIPHHDFLHRENSLYRTLWSQWDFSLGFFPNWEYFVSPQSQNLKFVSSINVCPVAQKADFGAVHDCRNRGVDNPYFGNAVYEIWMFDWMPFFFWSDLNGSIRMVILMQPFSSSIALGDPWNWMVKETSDFEGFLSLTWRWVIVTSTSSLGWMPKLGGISSDICSKL